MSEQHWRKASGSVYNGNCPEVGQWRKSGHSKNYGDCVEAGQAPAGVAVRDSKQRGGGPVLVIPAAAWQAFTRQASA